jgi:DNA-binding winged helix-turn-helix (wHTH) protein
MAAELGPMRVFRFGTFEADLENRQLFRNGISVGLTGQPFEVLALLLEHAGQLVTRKQLRARLWPAGTVVEFDHSIGAAITKLREVLDDEAQNPRFIATVPRHGYRFIAPVSTPAPNSLKTVLASSTSHVVSRWHRMTRWVMRLEDFYASTSLGIGPARRPILPGRSSSIRMTFLSCVDIRRC